MRNVETREGFEYWDKICSLTSYGFIHSSDNKRILKTPGIGNWIDKHEAQTIVDSAQDEINGLKAEREVLVEELTKLREDLSSANYDKEAYGQNAIDIRKRLDQAVLLLQETSMPQSRIDRILIG